ncbi:DNA helicase RecQ [Methanolobus halotolerans]|uniref:DNA 3'-5' helicase n=1 Tax=Methanolobus halotolerans TaxID=2052935 RepID=A0A4E0QB59_9EURY|nr:DNA helicase RecQ [Methanolobus halotolerans]TGC09774.1 DNA helicase RecQ [Methanolobus halotolerans]
MHQTLQKYFGYSCFRPLQEDIIKDVLEGRDTFVLMPTGGGKSLCYQLPALLLDGLTVVVSPLISLMKDQVDSLQASGINAACLNSTLNYTESRNIYRDVENNEIKILYMAPERLTMSHTTSLLEKVKVSLFAIDESHCISEWGHDFRPEYRKLSFLKRKFPEVPVIALTATATPKVREDTISQLRIKEGNTYVASFNRKNLVYRIRPKKETYNQILQYLRKHRGESGIIYCQSRRNVDNIAARLRKDHFNALPYHAGLSDSQRETNQERFIKDDVDIIVATVAFGMGIDKSNVRFVIHHDLPKNLEGYYQETGRGGRDGLECECTLFFSRGDRYKIEYFIKQKGKKEERDIALKQLQDMVAFCESTICRRKVLLGYFGEILEDDNCGKCDVCLQPRQKIDGTDEAKLLINCIDELGQRYGMNHVIDVLCGSNAKKIRDKKHNKLKSYGTGDIHTRDRWLEIAREMIQQNLIKVEGARYPLLKLNRTSMDIMVGKRTVTLTTIEAANVTDAEGLEEELPEEAMLFTENKTKASPAFEREKASNKENELFNRLKELRKSMAELQDVPPYVVFADTSLKQMASKKPGNKAEMLKITGVGEYKLKKYGDIFLKEISKYCEDQEGPSSAHQNVANIKETESPGIAIDNKKETLKIEQAKKRGRIVEAIKGLEKELIILTKAKLDNSFSDEEIKAVWSEILA